MTVSKRLRYEIFRRDNFACRYCGQRAPDAVLVVDHVIAVALGGDDMPENLVASCVSCNEGKASVPTNAELVADVATDAIRWAQAMEKVATSDRAKRQAMAIDIDYLREYLLATFGKTFHYPDDWRQSFEQFLIAGLSHEDVEYAMQVAAQKWGIKRMTHDEVWRYFCGVVWTMISRRQQQTRELLALEDQMEVADGTD